MAPVVVGAAALKRMAPVEFDLFLRAMQALKEATRDSYVAEDGRGIFQTQGKCQLLDQLVKKLEDCIQLDDQYRARR